MKKYLWNILISLDQFLSVLTFGDPDETVSSRTGKAARDGKWYGIIGQYILDKIFGKNHCKDSIEQDEGKNKIGEY